MSKSLTQLNNNVLLSCCALNSLGCVYHQTTHVIPLDVVLT